MQEEQFPISFTDVDVKRAGENSYIIRYKRPDGSYHMISWSPDEEVKEDIDEAGQRAIYKFKVFLGMNLDDKSARP